MKSDNALQILTRYFAFLNIDEDIRPPPDCLSYRLSEVLTAKKGQVPAELTYTFNKQAKPYINIKAFKRGIIEQYVISEDGVPVTENDLVIVWDGARCGLVGQGKTGILGSTLKKLSLKPAFNHVPLSYVQFFLQKNFQYLNTYSRGSVIQHLDPAIFWKLEIPVPPRNDGRFQRIDQLIAMLDAIEEQTDRQLQLVQRLKKSFLHEAFTPKKDNSGARPGTQLG